LCKMGALGSYGKWRYNYAVEDSHVMLMTYESEIYVKGKGKSVALHAWSDPEGSGKLRFLDYVTRAIGFREVKVPKLRDKGQRVPGS